MMKMRRRPLLYASIFIRQLEARLLTRWLRRSAKASSSRKTKKTRRNGRGGGARSGSGGELSERKRRLLSTKRIST